ncbi:hypothetical protein BJ165DRAFT_576983 [Panaeolus papilionaceus]|nr:hypothetical protein BJ165DRAFT_576983 [Panaeolus papilionaceus]
MRAIAGKSITLNPLVLDSRSTPLHTTVLSLLIRTIPPPRQTRISSMPHAPPSRLPVLQSPLASPHPRHLRLSTPVSEPDMEQISVVSFLLLGNEAGWRRRLGGWRVRWRWRCRRLMDCVRVGTEGARGMGRIRPDVVREGERTKMRGRYGVRC